MITITIPDTAYEYEPLVGPYAGGIQKSIREYPPLEPLLGPPMPTRSLTNVSSSFMTVGRRQSVP